MTIKADDFVVDLDVESGPPAPGAPVPLPGGRPTAVPAVNGDRVPPHSIAAEAAVLGACLLDTAATDKVLAVLGRADFYKPAHQVVFDAVQVLRSSGQVVDLVTVNAHLDDNHQLERAGGALGLADLTERIPSTLNVEAYSTKVRQLAQLRQLLGALQQSEQDVYANQADAAAVIEAAGERVLGVAEGRAVDFSALGSGWEAHLGDLEASSRGLRPLGFQTALPAWNRILGGIIPGKVYVIGGRPGEGKSTLALNLAWQMANKNVPTAFFSLEMDLDQMRDRVVAAHADIDGAKIEKGQMNEDELALYRATLASMRKHPLHFYHDPYMQLPRLLAMARAGISRLGLKVMFVDYIQMLFDDSQRWGTRPAEITHCCQRLAAFARAHRVAVIECAQLNRDLKKDEEPRVDHLKDSGGIEAAADVVGMLYDKKEEKYAGQALVPVEFIIGKHRGGDRGRMELSHARPYLRFENH